MRVGAIEVVTGGMRGHKSGIMIDALEYAQNAEVRVLALKPKKDTRHPGGYLYTRKFDRTTGEVRIFRQFPATEFETPDEILSRVEIVQPEIIGLDEAQFVGPEIVELVSMLAYQRGIDFYIAGLDLDYLRQPFGVMPSFMALADRVTKTEAICYRCKSRHARFTQKIGGSTNQVEVGDADLYRAACGDCWYPYRGEASK